MPVCYGSKRLADCVLLLLREQVLVTLLLLGRLVSHPRVDQSLVDPLAGADRGEAVPERVPSRHDLPFRVLHRPGEMGGRFGLCECGDRRGGDCVPPIFATTRLKPCFGACLGEPSSRRTCQKFC